MMFDYNLLGKGYAYADLRNVCSSLSEEAQKAFYKEYDHPYDEAEAVLERVASVLITLYFACRQACFPPFANAALADLKSPAYVDQIKRLLELAT